METRRRVLITDDQIIGRVLKGHTADYQELMRRHQGSVFRLAMRMLGGREEAEDVAQETFIKAYNSLSKCRSRDMFWPWIRRIAINICLRRNQRESPCASVDEMLDAGSQPTNAIETELLRQMSIAEVRTAVTSLPPNYRTVIVLKYDEDLAYSEIAELIGESADVVRVRLHRAKKMLAERLAVTKNEV